MLISTTPLVTCHVNCMQNMTLTPSVVQEMSHVRFGWLVGFGFNGPLRQYFSLYRAVSQREGERGQKG